GNSYQAQMPGFAHDLGPGDPGVAYTMLLGADAAGALVAGFLLESRGGSLLPTESGSAMRLALLWAVALPMLFLAGFFELSFSSMAQTLVQMNAPETIRGRVLGLFNMSAAGLRTFSGVTVGLAGSVTTIHTSLAASAAAFMAVTGILIYRRRQPAS